MNWDQLMGGIFTTGVVVLLICARRRMRTPASRTGSYLALLIGAWALSGGAMTHLFRQRSYTVPGQFIFFAVGIVLVASDYVCTRAARRTGGK